MRIPRCGLCRTSGWTFRHIGSNDTRITIALIEWDFDGIIILNQTQWSKISRLRVHSFRGPGIYMRTGPSGKLRVGAVRPFLRAVAAVAGIRVHE